MDSVRKLELPVLLAAQQNNNRAARARARDALFLSPSLYLSLRYSLSADSFVRYTRAVIALFLFLPRRRRVVRARSGQGRVARGQHVRTMSARPPDR